ncbi:MAG TPA: S41 family peptidase [Bryobacteraceae bacterium]|jgi:carboxyl-terminal processing protease|nr:S41 family peptidase [Bryobacteraceae bacterium]
MRRFFQLGALLIACLPLLSAADAPPDDDARQMKKFIDAYKILEQSTADPFDIDKAFYEGAVPGLLRHLDPHSVFFDPGQYGQLKQMETSTRKGFGSVVSVLPGRVLVLQTLPNTPSARAGMTPGDEILAVNNYRLDRLDSDQIIELLTESKQKPAQLVVRRPGNARLLDLELTPQDMQSSSVERVFELRPGIAYIRVAAFEEKTSQQIREGIEKLGGRNLKGLVLDLRNNPGGLMTAALETAAFFLKPGQVILSAKGRNVAETVEKVPDDNVPYTFPVAVIVNGKTASASEIVSGALQDHDRATITGEPSFGKGLVQSVFPLAENTGLALTTALYYIPSGRSIQKTFSSQKAFGAEGFALGATATHPNERNDFKTDSGRPVPGGGGIVPDIEVEPTPLTQFRAVLEQAAAYTSFATEYLRDHKVAAGWDITGEVLDQFQTWLSERRIQPSLQEWSQNRDFIQSRLKTEIYNLALGVEKGDEVEAQSDPQIQKALEAVLQTRS